MKILVYKANKRPNLGKVYRRSSWTQILSGSGQHCRYKGDHKVNRPALMHSHCFNSLTLSMLVLDFQFRFKSFQAIQGTKSLRLGVRERVRARTSSAGGSDFRSSNLQVWCDNRKSNPGSKVSKLFEIQTL